MLCSLRRGVGALVVTAAVAAGLAVRATAADLRIVGSDLLGLEFSKGLYAFAGRERLSLSIALDGSRPGLERLKTGRADLAVMVLPGEDAAELGGLAALTVAYHRVLVLAPAACPLEHLSLDQLARVFDGGFTGRAMRWGELGVEGDFGATNILPFAPDPGVSFTTEFFRRAVLRGKPCAGDRYLSPEALALHFTGESRVLALAPFAPSKEARAKVVALAAGSGEPPFLPTAENLHTGDYPLRLPLRVVYRLENTAALRSLLRFLSGEEAVPLWEAAGVVVLPASGRAQNARELEKIDPQNPPK